MDQNMKDMDGPDGLNWRKSRGLKTLMLRVGDVIREIESRIQEKDRINVLEVGCGYGRVLLELKRKYGDRLILHGINKDAEHGDAELMKKVALAHGLFTEAEVQTLKLPELFYFDVCQPWPLAANQYDIVFSHHSFLWFADKITPLEEINRVLTDGGIALLDLQVARTGAMRKNPIVIVDGDREIPCWSYFQAFKNIRIRFPNQTIIQRFWNWLNRRSGRKTKSIERRSYLELVKSKCLDFNLEFISSKLYAGNGQNRKGCQSIYRCK